MDKKQKIKFELRLQAVTAAEKIGVVKSAELYGITRKTLADWIKRYKSVGTAGLLNQSRIEQQHPAKTSSEIRVQILSYVADHPNSTLAEIKKELQLECSLMTINRIRKQATALQLPAVVQNHNSLTFYVEKFHADDSCFNYLFCCRDFKSGLLWTSVSNYNTPQALGIFADYLLSHLEIGEPLIYCAKGNFQLNKEAKCSYFETIVHQKHRLNCLKYAFKFTEESSILNFLSQRSGLSSEDQLNALYSLQSEINLSNKKKTASKNLWLPPLLIDKHLINSQQIKGTSCYWVEQSSSLKDKFRLVMQQLFEQKSEVKNLSALISLEELYELSLYSELDNPELRSQLQFEIGQALCAAGLYDQAVVIYQRMIRTATRNHCPAYSTNALKALAQIHFQKGELKQALVCYQKLLKETSINPKSSKETAIAAGTTLDILLKCAECLKKSGQFNQALYYYTQAEKLSVSSTAQRQIIMEQANLYHIKGNYRLSSKLLLVLLNKSMDKAEEIYDQLIINYLYSGDYDTAIYYGRLKCSLIDLQKNPREYYLTQAKIGFILYAKDKVPVSAEYFTGAANDYNKIIQSTSEIKIAKISAYHKLAGFLMMSGDYAGCIEMHKKILLLSYEINNPEQISNCYFFLSIDYSELNDYPLALKYSKKQLIFLLKLNKYKQIKECKLQIAHLYRYLSEFDKALPLFLEIRKVAEADEDTATQIEAARGCFEIYLQQKNAAEAKKELLKYRQLSEEHKLKRFINSFWVLQASFDALMDEKELQNFDSINNNFKKAIRLAKRGMIFKDYAELYYQYLLFLQHYKQDKLFDKAVALLAKHPLINCKVTCLDKLRDLIEQKNR